MKQRESTAVAAHPGGGTAPAPLLSSSGTLGEPPCLSVPQLPPGADTHRRASGPWMSGTLTARGTAERPTGAPPPVPVPPLPFLPQRGEAHERTGLLPARPRAPEVPSPHSQRMPMADAAASAVFPVACQYTPLTSLSC